ncbi:HAMP domain-containing protein [Lachnospiraceae bacterium NE2001]|nr:HAMP domain-containing protein [Lachnospiraceae bacterium NE2001]
MKKLFKIIIAFCVLYVLGIVIFAVATSSPKSSKVDTVKLNDITKTALDNWESLQNLDNEDFRVSFAVLGMSGQVLYMSDETVPKSITLETAMKNRYPYKYIDENGEAKGIVIMLDDISQDYRAKRIKLLIGLIIGGVIILIGMLLFGVYVQKRIITPFDKMQSFAGRVAEGKLDEPLLMDEGNMFGAFTESFDIMREELAESKKRELALQRKEKELVASLSHDLKTPITGIKLTTELLKAKLDVKLAGLANIKQENDPISENSDSPSKEKIGNSEKKEILDMSEKLDNIYKKADQIDVLVSDLFTATLDDLGEFKVNCQDEDSAVISELLRKNDDRGLVSEDEIPKLVVNIDKRRMSQVVGNILINSYKYAGTKISVRYAVVEGFLEMSIRDFGPGVKDDELELITNKFYRGKQAEESGQDGSGLGLYIARNLMEKMNGELTASNAERGFVVTLLIPLS